MQIGVDVDGVLACFEKGFAKLLTRRTGIEFPLDDPGFPSTWHWERAAGVPREFETAAWEEVKNSDFWGELPALPDARPALDQLVLQRFLGDNVYFITTRPGRFAKLLTEQWLEKQGYRNPTVLIAGGSKEKGTLARGLHLDLFIDDKPENCIEVLRATLGSCRVCLVNRPYNQAPLIGAIERVASAYVALVDGADYGIVQAA